MPVRRTLPSVCSEHQREAAVASSRADALQQELDEARAQVGTRAMLMWL